MSKKISPHILSAHAHWQVHLRPADTAIDMTCGNGHDTLFLSQLLPHGHLIGFDIQQAAIDQTRALVGPRPTLHCRSHADIDQIPLPCPPRLIVYNLGYLPGGDKTLTTHTDTTLISLQKAIQLVASDGAISLTCYPGHPEGEREEKAIVKFLRTIPSHEWTICHHQWINRPKAPSLIWMEKTPSR